MANTKEKSSNTKAKKPSTSKKTVSKSKKSSNSGSNVLRREISGVIIVAIASFMIFVVNQTGQMGIAGEWIKKILMIIFGKGMFVLPFAIMLMGVLQLIDKIIYSEKKQLISICGVFVCVLMILTIRDCTLGKSFSFDSSFTEMLKLSFNPKIALGGGLIGNILSYILVKLLGVTGTYIFITAVILVYTIIFTNQSLIGFCKLIINLIKKFIKTIFNFVYVEVDENGNEIRHKKQTAKKSYNSSSINQDLNIYEYNENGRINSNNENITQLSIDDISNNASKYKNSKKTLLNLEKSNTSNNFNNDFNNCDNDISENHIAKDNAIKNSTINNSTDANNLNIKNEELNSKNNDFNSLNKKDNGSNDDSIKNIKIVDNSIEPGTVPVTEYVLPDPSLLNSPKATVRSAKEDLRRDAEKLIETLNSFNISCTITNINKGPTITRYELQPAPGIKVSKITSLHNDIALNLATSDIRIEAPIPGKSAIGIEVPNKEKTAVLFKGLVESKEFNEAKTKVPFALGKDIAGKNIIGNIETMPHLLVAGATGSGKSVCINTLIMSILYKAKPDEVKLILVDPKVVELSIYNGIPHLLIPVVTDPRKASNALNWAVSEMTSRYKLFAQNSVRDIFSYNNKMIEENKLEEKMPQIVIIIDELADLMQVAPGEVEECITRIAQLARACGIHLVIATQRPSVDVITGTIKANIPSRIAFAVSSYIDSRTILDASGAEKLLGKGDMLYHPMGMPKPIRVQGTFISDDEIKRVVEYIKEQKIQQKISEINAEIEKAPAANEKVDELLQEAIELVVNEGMASASYLQRKFSIGYNRAARLIDAMEERGIISGYDGSKPRKVLISKEEFEEMKE